MEIKMVHVQKKKPDVDQQERGASLKRMNLLKVSCDGFKHVQTCFNNISHV
jgi:ribosomal protein S27E